jgi:hypothetical protein
MMVKKKRVCTEAQQGPIKHILFFLFNLLAKDRTIRDIKLSTFLKVDVCKKMDELLRMRGTGSERIFQLFLTVKKVLIYLSSLQSIRTQSYIPPTSFAAFLYVDSLCHDATVKRKQAARNRKLGLTDTSSDVSHIYGHAFSTASSSRSSANGMSNHTAEEHKGMQPTDASHHPDRPRGRNRNNTILTTAELRQVAQAVQRYLEQAMAAIQKSSNFVKEPENLRMFPRYLVTATLIFGLAPRSQVLKQMEIGKTLIEEDGHFTICMPAQLSKSGKPTIVPLNSFMSRSYQCYLQHIRPLLCARAHKQGTGDAGQHTLVFMTSTGTSAKKEFSSWTRSVTEQVLGKQVHKSCTHSLPSTCMSVLPSTSIAL